MNFNAAMVFASIAANNATAITTVWTVPMSNDVTVVNLVLFSKAYLCYYFLFKTI